MNCNCIEIIQNQLIEKGDYNNREIIEVDMPHMLWNLSGQGGRSGLLSYEEFPLELKGLKRPSKIKVSHTYCPFCGIKAGKLSDDEQSAISVQL